MPWIRWLEELDHDDAPLVGAKCAALGETVRHLPSPDVRVPGGVALIADAYRAFLRHNELVGPIERALAAVPSQTVDRLGETSALLRRLVLAGTFPDDIAREVCSAYRSLSRVACDPIDATERAWVSVRSSVIAPSPATRGRDGEGAPRGPEPLAGQHDTYLYVHGEEQLLDRVRRCFASLFHPFALSHRAGLGVAPEDVAMAVLIQRMVQADQGCSGEAFTLDPASGDPEVVLVTSSWGLGESVVQGRVGPDTWYLHKEGLRRRRGYSPVVVRRPGPKELQLVWDEDARDLVQRAPSAADRARLTLEDDEVVTLGRFAVRLEEHWSRLLERPTPVDIAWAKDGATGQLHVLQVRPSLARREAPAPNESWGSASWTPGLPSRSGTLDPGALAVLQRLAPSDPLGFERNRLRTIDGSDGNGGEGVQEEALTRLVEEALAELPPQDVEDVDALPPSTL